MGNILKAAKLDFSLIRPYAKNILFTMAIPILLAALNKSLINGISFAMCFVGAISGYAFSISEKNSMERFYGILPLSKKSIVVGRYLHTCMMGLATLLLALASQSLVLCVLGVDLSLLDVVVAALIGIVLFSLYTVFLLPGYYKFGSIKGRVFMFFPVIGYLVVLFCASELDLAGNPFFVAIFSDSLVAAASILLVCTALFLISIAASVRILNKKEV